MNEETPIPITIQLDPYVALTICTFLEEFKPELSDTRLTVLRESIETFQATVYAKVTTTQIEECHMRREINRIQGLEPDPDDHTVN